MTVSGIVSAVVVGAIIGALGRLIVPGRQNLSPVLTVVIGIVAALVGTFVARLMVDVNGFSLVELLLQVALAGIGVGAVVMASTRRSVD